MFSISRYYVEFELLGSAFRFLTNQEPFFT